MCTYMSPIHAQIVNQGQNFFYIENYFMKKANERTIARGAVAAYNISTHTYICLHTSKHTYAYLYVSVYMLVDKQTHTHTLIALKNAHSKNNKQSNEQVKNMANTHTYIHTAGTVHTHTYTYNFSDTRSFTHVCEPAF